MLPCSSQNLPTTSNMSGIINTNQIKKEESIFEEYNGALEEVKFIDEKGKIWDRNSFIQYYSSRIGDLLEMPCKEVDKVIKINMNCGDEKPGISNLILNGTSNSHIQTPKRIRSSHYCPFCYTFVYHFSRHLYRHHCNIPTVKRIFDFPSRSKKRLIALAELRNLGFFFSKTGKNKMKLGKKPTPIEYFQCTSCLGHYTKNTLYIHRRLCLCNGAKSTPGTDSKNLFATTQSYRDNNSSSSSNMSSDNITFTAKNDTLLCLFADWHLKVHKNPPQTIQKLRELTQFKLVLGDITDHPTSHFIDFLKPEMYDNFISTLKIICNYDSDTKTFENSPLVAQMSLRLSRLCEIAKKAITSKVIQLQATTRQEKTLKLLEIQKLRLKIGQEWSQTLLNLTEGTLRTPKFKLKTSNLEAIIEFRKRKKTDQVSTEPIKKVKQHHNDFSHDIEIEEKKEKDFYQTQYEMYFDDQAQNQSKAKSNSTDKDHEEDADSEENNSMEEDNFMEQIENSNYQFKHKEIFQILKIEGSSSQKIEFPFDDNQKKVKFVVGNLKNSNVNEIKRKKSCNTGKRQPALKHFSKYMKYNFPLDQKHNFDSDHTYTQTYDNDKEIKIRQNMKIKDAPDFDPKINNMSFENIKTRRPYKRWTRIEKKLVLDYFKENIDLKRPPKKWQCMKFIRENGKFFKESDWLRIKSLVFNTYRLNLKNQDTTHSANQETQKELHENADNVGMIEYIDEIIDNKLKGSQNITFDGTYGANYKTLFSCNEGASFTDLLFARADEVTEVDIGQILQSVNHTLYPENEANMTPPIQYQIPQENDKGQPELVTQPDLDFINMLLTQEDNINKELKTKNVKTKRKEKNKIKKLNHRKRWTNYEKNLVLNYFNEHLKDKKQPKKKECFEFIAKNQDYFVLNDWKRIKILVYNTHRNELLTTKEEIKPNEIKTCTIPNVIKNLYELNQSTKLKLNEIDAMENLNDLNANKETTTKGNIKEENITNEDLKKELAIDEKIVIDLNPPLKQKPRRSQRKSNIDLQEKQPKNQSHTKDDNETKFNKKELKNKQIRKHWTKEEKQLVLTYFKNHIKHKIAPKKFDCRIFALKTGGIFKLSDWVKVKTLVYNTYKDTPIDLDDAESDEDENEFKSLVAALKSKMGVSLSNLTDSDDEDDMQVRKHWENCEKTLVLDYFSKHIQKKTAPKKNECFAFITKYNEFFDEQDWVRIKTLVYNTYRDM